MVTCTPDLQEDWNMRGNVSPGMMERKTLSARPAVHSSISWMLIPGRVVISEHWVHKQKT